MARTRSTTVTSADGTPLGVRSLGEGEGLLVIGGALRQAEDYLPLARQLATRFTVHVLDRRGRGSSGPLGEDYSMDRECEDLDAVVRATGATRVFGHSYGGLVALQAAARSTPLTGLTLYEPAVSVAGSLPSDWLDGFEQRLLAGDSRGAFATLVKGAGGAPPALTRMPTWYVQLVLRAAVRGQRWRQTESLLPTALLEHREVARLEGVDQYRAITAEVLVLVGARSPRRQHQALRQLAHTLPHARLQVLPALDHLAPESAPGAVAELVATGRPTSSPT